MAVVSHPLLIEARPAVVALSGEVATPQVERSLVVVLGGFAVVHRQIRHGESVSDTWNTFHDSTDTVAMKLIAEPVDQLRCGGTVDLRECEVELAAHSRQVDMR